MEFRKKLQSIDGVNKAIAARIIEKGFDSLEKLADAKPAELGGIEGLSEKIIPEIIVQAKTMLESQKKQEESLAKLTGEAEQLKGRIEKLVLNIRDSFDDTAASKDSLKELRKETARTLASLERVETALSGQMRRLGKGLAKANQKVSEVARLDVDEVMSGLRKARKKIDKAFD